jgi:hypothetical protein
MRALPATKAGGGPCDYEGNCAVVFPKPATEDAGNSLHATSFCIFRRRGGERCRGQIVGIRPSAAAREDCNPLEWREGHLGLRRTVAHNRHIAKVASTVCRLFGGSAYLGSRSAIQSFPCRSRIGLLTPDFTGIAVMRRIKNVVRHEGSFRSAKKAPVSGATPKNPTVTTTALVSSRRSRRLSKEVGTDLKPPSRAFEAPHLV